MSNIFSHKTVSSRIMRSALLSVFFFVLVSSLSFSALAAESSQTKTTFLQDKLDTAREYQVSDSQASADVLLAQAGEEVKENPKADFNPYKTGAGAGAYYYENKDWRAFTSLYLWFVSMNGETGKGRQVADVDVGFGDIWDNLDFGIQAHVEVWYKKMIFFVDPIYMNLSASNKNTRVLSSLKSEVDLTMFLLDMAAGYRVAEIPLGSGGASKGVPSLAIDLYGGGRLIDLDSTLKLTIDTPVGKVRTKEGHSETWFDFIIGTRFLFDITDDLLFSVKSDIGGFGLGFSSNIDWNFVANIGYQLPWYGITPYVGYRILYIDYKDGSGDNRFVYDVWNTGPQIGLGVNF